MAIDQMTEELVNQMPDLVEGKVEGPTWSQAERILDPLLAGGQRALTAVIDMLHEVDNGSDYKARYTLHSLAVHTAKSRGEEHHETMVDTLVAAVRSDRPKPIRAFLIRQLQVCGTPRVVPVLAPLLMDETLCEPAAQALLALEKNAAGVLRRVLSNAPSENRLTIVNALAILGDKESVAALKEAARNEDQQVRLAALWGLARLGETSAAGLALRAANRQGWERIQGVKACLLLGERLEQAGRDNAAKRLYGELKRNRHRPSEDYVLAILDGKT